MSDKKKKGILDGYKTYDTSNGFGSADQWRKAFDQRMGFDEAQEILSQQKDSPHSILGVKVGASKDEIKKAYRKLVMQWHPDKNKGDKQAEEMFKKIYAAYSVIG